MIARILMSALLLLPLRVRAQEKGLKRVYTTITNAINTAILTRRGSNEIGGSIFYNSWKTEYDTGEKTTEHIFDAELGLSRFIANNLSLGILLSYLDQNNTVDGLQNGTSFKQTMVGPSLKTYFGNERTRPFVFAQYLFLKGDQFDGGELGLGLGALYHLAGNVGIAAQVKYGILFHGKSTIERQSRILLGLGLTNFIL